MEKFTEAYKHYLEMKPLGDYRFCWIPINDKGNGYYSVIEFYDDELIKLDPKKIQVIKL